ncbi:MAG: hypothetical protein ACFE8M_12940 [Candidatus Hermodarchaeota archaeon]
MPIRVRWRTKEYIPFAFMIFGACGFFQILFIFIAQYLLSVGNHYVVILIPLGATIALYFGATIIFEAYAQIERKKKLKTQFQKSRVDLSALKRILNFPIVRPLLIMFIIFTIFFFISYYIGIFYLDNTFSFLVAENFSTLVCLLIANLIEKRIGKVKRY